MIWGIAAQVNIADISHAVQPQNVLHGALLLGRAYRYFPGGSIHVAVVDPGVGTARRGIALQVGKHTFVGPDNGLFTVPLTSGEPFSAVSLDNAAYHLPAVSHSFHGRDVFAPVAAHLANGVPLSAMGEPVIDPMILNIPKPLRVASGWQAQVLLVDGFGNLITNLSEGDLQGPGGNGSTLSGAGDSRGECHLWQPAAGGIDGDVRQLGGAEPVRGQRQRGEGFGGGGWDDG